MWTAALKVTWKRKEIRENWACPRTPGRLYFRKSRRAIPDRARRAMARRMDAELYVVHVDREFGPRESNQSALASNLKFAESLGAKVVRLKGRSVADAVSEFVRSKHITQVLFGRAPVRDWRKYLYLSAVHRFLRESPPDGCPHRYAGTGRLGRVLISGRQQPPSQPQARSRQFFVVPGTHVDRQQPREHLRVCRQRPHHSSPRRRPSVEHQ